MRGPGSRPAATLAALAACLIALPSAPSDAATILVPPGPGSLSRACAEAASGDTLLLAAGRHDGSAVVDRPLTIRGEAGAVVRGDSTGSVLFVTASSVRIEDLAVERSGDQPLSIDAGVLVKGASRVRVTRVRMRDVLYGVAAERAESLVVEDCDLRGRAKPTGEVEFSMDDSNGNGVHLWYCHDSSVRSCRITRFVDGIYLSFAFRAEIRGSLLWENSRYGLHTMYCQENRLEENRFTRNIAGCAIMFSNRLRIERNDFVLNRGPRTYGVLLRDCSDGRFAHNRFVDNTVGIFMDGSNRNVVRENLVQDNGWGLILFSSCAGNEFAGNNFWSNDYPVALDMRRSDNRFDDGRRGNYWSENAPYDLDGDGVSDIPFSPVSAFAFLSKQYPDLAILGRSPAAAALSVAERTIPALRPSEIVDHFPLVSPAPMAPAAPAPEPVLPAGRGTRAAALAGFALLAAGGVAGVFVRGRAESR
ncbi:MAG TPA: nitrous oxide reductase family maturation protein NosD [Candidatus Eisenbacteria bacterium]|nr:nitrous oxide reductase family maturation protein NosD [Candidatus Eisenbacteria bacterium]